MLATRGDGWLPNVLAHMQPKSFWAIFVLDKSASEFPVDAKRRCMLFDASWKAYVVYVVVKLDFSNAFNCLHRDFMLARVAEMVPELYRFCHLAYSNHFSLQFGEFLVSSQVCSQQGNKLGGGSSVLPGNSSHSSTLVLPIVHRLWLSPCHPKYRSRSCYPIFGLKTRWILSVQFHLKHRKLY